MNYLLNKRLFPFTFLLLFLISCETRNNSASEVNNDNSQTYTAAEVRQIMENVWQPIQNFYELTGVGAPANRELPEQMDTPESLQKSLEQTMSPALAIQFTRLLIMERNGRYEVRRTERVRTLQHVETQLIIDENSENRLVVIEQFPASELYGSQPRRNVLEKQEGQWKLIDVQ